MDGRSFRRGEALVKFWDLATHLSSFRIATKEMQRKRSAQVEVECLQNAALHAADVCVRVRVVSDVLEVADLRRVHLLVLGRNQHRRDANQLQFGALNPLNLKCRRPRLRENQWGLCEGQSSSATCRKRSRMATVRYSVSCKRWKRMCTWTNQSMRMLRILPEIS